MSCSDLTCDNTHIIYCTRPWVNEWLNLTSFLGESPDSDVHVIHITHVIITCSLETLSSHEAVAQQIMKQTDETWPKDMATRYINGRQGDIRRWVCRKNWIILQCVRYVSFFFSSHLFKCSRDLSVFIFKCTHQSPGLHLNISILKTMWHSSRWSTGMGVVMAIRQRRYISACKKGIFVHVVWPLRSHNVPNLRALTCKIV